MKKDSDHSAKPSYVGYVFQGFYALLLLLEAEDNTQVSIETMDDIELSDPKNITLYQLKHSSSSSPSNLTITNEGLWKTITIWGKYASDKQVSTLMFVTSAAVSKTDSLKQIENKFCDEKDLSQLISDLEEEANRVIDERASSTAKKKPHETRYKGCELFTSLSSKQRASLLRKIIIVSKAIQINDISKEVTKKLSVIPLQVRQKVSAKLIEWWSVRVIKSLYEKQEEIIYKSEVLEKVFELIQECREDSLSDEYKDKSPDDTSIYKGSTMEKQIAAVRGGNSRLNRATKARWRAMNQRNVWLLDNVSVAPKLNRFDKRLIDEWKDKFEVLVEACNDFEDDKKCMEGLELLDWTHDDAPKIIPPIVERWNGDFLVRGTYQELADKGEVGWHPDYEKLIKI